MIGDRPPAGLGSRGRPARVAMTVSAVALLALTACSRSDSVSSSDGTAPAATTASTGPTIPPPATTAPAATTTPVDTTAPATAPAPATTAPPTTAPMTVPVTTEPPVPTTAPARDDGGTPTPDGPAPETAFVTTGTDLVEIDVATGTVLRVVEEFFNGDGVFRGGLRLTSDRRSAYFNEGYEDSWYGCESSKGSIGRIDLVSGDIDRVATGSWVGLSTDGTRLAYVTSDLCLPDPEQPDLWVLTPADRVVVETVGGVVQYVTASPPDSYDAPTAIDWAGFGGDDLLVLTAAGDLHRIPPDGAPVVQDNPIVGSGLAVLPVGMLGGRLLAIELGDEGSADLQLIDLVTGTVTPLASAESFMSAGISEGGHVAVVAFSDVTVVPGAPVTVVTPPPDDSYFDIDW